MENFLMGCLLGFSFGFGGAWLYFALNNLIRTREEWLAAKEKDEE